MMPAKARYIPVVQNIVLRTVVGFLLLVVSTICAVLIHGAKGAAAVVLISVVAWLPAVLLTDKYAHKYPQRYYDYLVGSHLKAAIIMAVLLCILSMIAGPLVSSNVVWTGFFVFVIADALVSIPRRPDFRDIPSSVSGSSDHVNATTSNLSSRSNQADGVHLSSIDTQVILSQVTPDFEQSFVAFLEDSLPESQSGNGNVLILDSVIAANGDTTPTSVGLLISRSRLNDVRRLNQFFLSCANHIDIGGYFATRYLPHENAAKDLKNRYQGFFYWPVFISYFIWHRAFPKIPWLNAFYFYVTQGKNRVLSMVEVWGRLSYCGMKVTTESSGDGERYLLAQRTGFPIENRRPSYYPVVALEKVGLDGEIIRTHKLRTMFPYSEFLQKRVYEEHGLASTGKFKDDFRRTEYGKFLRKYWLDELPQIYDWLRGDIKLVGLRATSPHFLGLYPKHFYDLYIQVKPGLIPPIFDESTDSFEKIVAVELEYLESYWAQPLRTDIKYLIQTLTDIVLRGVRSK